MGMKTHIGIHDVDPSTLRLQVKVYQDGLGWVSLMAGSDEGQVDLVLYSGTSKDEPVSRRQEVADRLRSLAVMFSVAMSEFEVQSAKPDASLIEIDIKGGPIPVD
jgi:hypothetical protein